MQSLKAGYLALALTVAASGAALAAPAGRSTSTRAGATIDSCPAGLVCYTLAEEAALQAKEEATARRAEVLAAELARLKWRKRIGLFAEGRFGVQMSGPTVGRVGVGAFLGPLSVSIGASDYGAGLRADAEVAFRYSW